MRSARTTSGLLDYDDLIGRTSHLLVDPGAAWVLYKLDGGLDHLLLDEVQDTAPAQWRIAHALTAEFFAGAAAREADRTVFAVGDRKQSIYSFQGADIEEFDRSHRPLADAGAARRASPGATRGWTCRSARPQPVLELVDRVFADPTGRRRCRRAGPDAHPLRRPGGPCRRGGALAAGAAARCDRSRCRGPCRSRTRA